MQIKFGLEAEQRRERGLRIEIDRQGAIAPHGEILRHMRGGRGFAGAAFEIRDGDDLEMFALASIRGIAVLGLAKRATNFVDLLQRKQPAAARRLFCLRSVASK